MYAFRRWRGSALAVAFVLTASSARAGLITPDSIPNPPSAVDPANGTPILASNSVTTQYAGLGLNFSSGTAITHLNSFAVWAPTGIVVGGPVGVIDYAKTLFARVLSPGSSNPTTVSSLSVETVGQASLSMSVYGLKAGLPLNITPVRTPVFLGGASGPPSALIWTFTGSGISGFSVFPSYPPPMSSANGTWGVAEVSFTPASAPEPSSLILAGLGALGLAARLGWRRVRAVA